MSDWRWMTKGGLLLDGNNDIAVTTSPIEELETMTATRLKAALDGWQLYSIGADLETFKGQTISPGLLLTIERQVQAALTKQFLPSGTFTVNVVSTGDSVEVYVFLGNKLIASTGISI